MDILIIKEMNAISTWNYSLPFLNNNTLETECDDGTIKSGDADRDVATQREDALVAAIHLFDLTGSNSYEQYVTNNLNDAEQIATPFWGCYKLALSDALLLYTTLPNTNNNTVNAILNAANIDVGNNGNDYFGFSNADLYRAFMPDWSYHWGSNQASAGYGVINLQMKKYGILPASADDYERKANDQTHWIDTVEIVNLL
ncbi:MAG: glycoside hydrolase, partial [Bacteroidota bacterium]